MAGRAGQLQAQQVARPQAVSKEHNVSRKENFLTCLNRLGDRDTQRSAADALVELVQDPNWLDGETLPMVVNSLCSTGSEQKPYAKREVARLLAKLSSSSCPLRSMAVTHPYLPKIASQLKKLMQDGDTSVRDAASEAMASLAAGMAQVGDPAAALPASQHPVGKMLLDSLQDGKKELQVAACTALGLAARHLGPIDSAFVKDLIKRLNTPSFQAVPALISAIGWTDTHGYPAGLLPAAPGVFCQQLTALVGGGSSQQASSQQNGGSSASAGLVACLGSKDWQSRKAAADCVRVAALVLGPLLEGEGSWMPGDSRSLTHRLLRALEVPKFDKVREARDMARDAAATLEDLMAYGRAGGDTAGWAARVAGLLQPAQGKHQGNGVHHTEVIAKGSPVNIIARPGSPNRPLSPSRLPNGNHQPRSSSPRARPPSAPPASPPRERTPPFQRQGSLADRFRKAADDKDTVKDLGSRAPFGRRSGDGVTKHMKEDHQDMSDKAGPIDGALPPTEQQPPVLPTLPTPQPSQPAHNALAAAATRSTLKPGTLKTRKSSGSGSGNLAAPPLPVKPLPAPTSNSSHSRDAMQTITVPLSEWQGLQNNLRQMEARQRELTDQLAALSVSSTKTITQLQDRIRELEDLIQRQQTVTLRGSNSETTWFHNIAAPFESPRHSLQSQYSPPASPSRSARQNPSAPSSPAVSQPVSRPAPSWPSTNVSKSAHLNPSQRSPRAAQPHRNASSGGWITGTYAASCANDNINNNNVVSSSPRTSMQSMQHQAPFPSGDNIPSIQRSSSPQPTAANSSPRSNLGANQASSLVGMPFSPSTAPAESSEVNAAFQQAIAAWPQSAELQHLLSRTGAAWSSLQPVVAKQLLGVFTQMLQDPFTLPRVLPWLWRLADESAAPTMQPQACQQGCPTSGISTQEQAVVLARVQAAANAWQANNHPEMASKLTLLHQTLQSHWAAGRSNSATASQQPQAALPTETNPGASNAIDDKWAVNVLPKQATSNPSYQQSPVNVNACDPRALVQLRCSAPQPFPANNLLQNPSDVSGISASHDSLFNDLSRNNKANTEMLAVQSQETAVDMPAPRWSLSRLHMTTDASTEQALPMAVSGAAVTTVSAGTAFQSPASDGLSPDGAIGIHDDALIATFGGLAVQPETTVDPQMDAVPQQMSPERQGLAEGAQSAVNNNTPFVTSQNTPGTNAVVDNMMAPVMLPDQALSSIVPISAVPPNLRPINSVPVEKGTPLTAPTTPSGSTRLANKTSHRRATSGETARDWSPPGGQATNNGSRPQLANLDALKQQLDDLERNFQQSPAFQKARLLTEAAKERATSVSPALSGRVDGIVEDEHGNVVCQLPPSQLSNKLPSVETTTESPDARPSPDQNRASVVDV